MLLLGKISTRFFFSRKSAVIAAVHLNPKNCRKKTKVQAQKAAFVSISFYHVADPVVVAALAIGCGLHPAQGALSEMDGGMDG